MYCKGRTSVQHHEWGIRARPLFCKRWSCPECAPNRQRGLKKLAEAGEPTTFITLTVDPKQPIEPDEQARRLVQAWRTIRRRTAKLQKVKSIPFLAVFESTARGMPHLHVIARMKYLHQKLLSEWLRELTGAYVVDIRRVSSARAAARYITKYISKEPRMWEGCKRYWRSQDFRLTPADPPVFDDDGPTQERYIANMHIEDLCARYDRASRKVWKRWNLYVIHRAELAPAHLATGTATGPPPKPPPLSPLGAGKAGGSP